MFPSPARTEEVPVKRKRGRPPLPRRTPVEAAQRILESCRGGPLPSQRVRGLSRPDLRTSRVCAAQDGRVPHSPCCIRRRSEEHTSELQSLLRSSYAVCCLQKKIRDDTIPHYSSKQIRVEMNKDKVLCSMHTEEQVEEDNVI